MTIPRLVEAHNPISDVRYVRRRWPSEWIATGRMGHVILIRVEMGMIEIVVLDDQRCAIDHARSLAYTSSADGAGDMETEEMMALTGFVEV